MEIASKKTRTFDLTTFYVTKNNKKSEGKIQSRAMSENIASPGVSSSDIGIVTDDTEKVNSNSQTQYQYTGYDDFGMLEGEYEDDEFDSEALDRFAEDYTRLESLRALVEATKPKKSSVMAAANIICKKYGISSTAAKTELVTRLESYYESINSGASAADVFKTSQDIAAWLYNQRKNLPLDEYAQNTRK